MLRVLNELLCGGLFEPAPIYNIGFYYSYEILQIRIIELWNKKTNNLHNVKTKMQINCAVTAQLISTSVFATRIVNHPFS